MAGCARHSTIPVGLAFAVCMTGFALDSARGETGEGSGLLLGGVTAYAPVPLGPTPDDVLAKALDLPPSRGPVAHVPLPRERTAALGEVSSSVSPDPAAEDHAALQGIRVAVPLPRIRPVWAEDEAAPAGSGPAPAEAASAEASAVLLPAVHVSVPLPPVRPAQLAFLEEAEAEPEAGAALPVFASGPAPGEGGIRSLIARHASANGIPFGLADAIVRVESRYNPRARNGANIGLMQISLPTARSLGYGGPAAGLSDADTNLTYGVRYLAMAYRLADGDTCRTILKYQGGHRAVTMTSAARSYCDKVRVHAANLR